MSEVIVCDCCGKTIKKVETIRFEGRHRAFFLKCDLCNDCTKDFREFMKLKRKERENNER